MNRGARRAYGALVIRPRRFVPFRPILVACAALTLGMSAPQRSGASPASPTPPIQLVESVPVEAGLGNPDLPRARDVWPALIAGARRSIDFEEFYFSNGPALEPVVTAIGDAARRGVRVRILLDRRMHDTYSQPADSLGHLPGIEVREVDFGPLAGGVQHAKYFLVDGSTVFVGSQNLDWRALEHIHELGLAVRDARLAKIFGDVFASDWALAANPADSAARRALSGDHPVGELPIVIVQAPGDTARLWPSYSPRGWIPDSTRWDRDAVVRLIDSARHDLVGQSLTYSSEDRRNPDPAIHDALTRAAARGVIVRLVISDWESDEGLAQLRSLSAVPGISVRLSRVPDWSGGYVPFARVEHCKYLVADSARLWVGTGNLEPSYFFRTRNLALTIENGRLAGAAVKSFEASWRAAATQAVQPDSRFTPRAHGEGPPHTK
ncbi:MAG TPA: phospholipase D-like domain-containing protein [Candidatus Udaeobacter sp.]|nr:phospholipase D-like domain-containing protein [Candidatus Udaeobacter sp.]